MITSSTCVSKYSLKAMTLNPSCLNKSPAFTVTMLPSTSKLISERLFDLNHMPKYSKNKIIKNISDEDLLTIMLWTFRISEMRFKFPAKLTIVIHKDKIDKINLLDIKSARNGL